MKKQMLFETYLHTVQMSQNSFMQEYQAEILPLLESNNVTMIHHKLKSLARASELSTVRRSEVTLDKLSQKASLVLESNKFALIQRVHAIGVKYPGAAALASAMITTAIVENKNPELVLVPGIKALHRAFLSEADIPDGFQFETEGGAIYRRDGDDWYDVRGGRDVPVDYEDTINAQAKKAFEQQEITIPEEEVVYHDEDNDEDAPHPYLDYLEDEVPDGFQIEDDDGNTWTYDDDVWTNASTDEILDGDAHDGATQSALHQIAYDQYLENHTEDADDAEYEAESTFDVDTNAEDNAAPAEELYQPVAEPTGEYTPEPGMSEETPESDVESDEETDDFKLTPPVEPRGPNLPQEDDITFDTPVDDPSQQHMDFSEPKVQKIPKSVDAIPRGYEIEASNGTKFKWAGAMWQYENDNGKFVPVPKEYKTRVARLVSSQIDAENERIAAEKQAKAAEKQRKTDDKNAATQKTRADKETAIAAKFDIGDEFVDEEPADEEPVQSAKSETTTRYQSQDSVAPSSFKAGAATRLPKKANYAQADEVRAMNGMEWDPAAALSKYAEQGAAAKVASEESAAWDDKEADDAKQRQEEEQSWAEQASAARADNATPKPTSARDTDQYKQRKQDKRDKELRKQRFKRDEQLKAKQAQIRADGAAAGVSPELKARAQARADAVKTIDVTEPDAELDKQAKDWLKNERVPLESKPTVSSSEQRDGNATNTDQHINTSRRTLIDEIKRKLAEKYKS